MTSSHGHADVNGRRRRRTLDGAAGAAPAIELSEQFFISSNGSRTRQTVRIQVILNGAGVYLRRETNVTDHINEQLLRLDDIVGSHCGRRLRKRARGGLASCSSPGQAEAEAEEDAQQQQQQQEQGKKDISAYLYIFVYLKEEKPLRRSRTVRILRFRTHSTYEENLRIAERWHAGIRQNKAGQGTAAAAAAAAEGKPLLILLNPKSGKAKGRELFQQQVAPVLKEAEVPYELLVTTHANHARELLSGSRALAERYAGVIVASGDGLFYEVLNGLMERPDWRSIAQQLPLGIIPCGSGNGLAKSIAQLYGEPYEPKPVLCGTLACLAGRTAPMDIVRVEYGSRGGGKTTIAYSFLSVGWGLIADIDIESERLRSIGSPRFTVWSVHRVISLRTYRGKLAYLPCRQLARHSTISSGRPRQTPAAGLSNGRQSLNGPAAAAAPGEFQDAIDEEFMDIISIGQASGGRSNMDSWHSAASKRTAYYSLAGGGGSQSGRSQRSSLAASMASRIEAANAALEASTLRSTLPPLNSPLPADGGWHCEEGEYVMVHAANTTHLAADCHFAPDSRLDDGIIYLVIIRGGIARAQLVQFLLSLSSGTHLPQQPNKYIEVVAVQAFRIEPQADQAGIMTVDGERVEYAPMQCEMFSGLINVMVPNGM